MATDRRRFLTLLGAGAAGAAVGVPSLEAQTTRAFSEMGETGAAAALSEARRAYFGQVTPFMATPAPVDTTQLSKAHELDAKSMTLDDERPNVYYALWNANGPGANGSYWLSEILGRVRSSEEADITITLHPRNFPADPADPTAQRFLPGASSFHWENPLDMFFGGSGTAWLEIRSSEPLDFSDGYTFNQAQDGTRQGQAGPIIDAAGIPTDPRFARTGDVLNFELYGREFGEPEGSHRENWLLFAPPESGTARVDYQLIDANGVQKSGLQTLWLEPGTWKQLDGMHTAFPDTVVRPGDKLRVTVHATNPAEEALLYSIMSKVDNQDPEKQDPYSDEGYIHRGIAATEVRRNSGEVNDPKVSYARVEAGPGAVIDAVYIDWQGDGSFDDRYNDLEDAVFEHQHLGQFNNTPGTFTPKMRVFFTAPDGTGHQRDFEGEEYQVEEALPDFPEDSYQKTADNIDTLANILGAEPNAVYLGTMKHYDEATMAGILAAYVNGVASSTDGELDHVEIRKADNAVVFALTDQTNAVWGGLNHVQINRLRDVYDVER